jgi:hypothetical protein
MQLYSGVLCCFSHSSKVILQRNVYFVQVHIMRDIILTLSGDHYEWIIER